MNRLFQIMVATFALAFAQSALAFYNHSNGRWLNRDPARERGGLNLHGFVRNNPISGFDAFGLAYTITDLTPSGLWMLSVRNVTVPTWGEIKGFHSRYLPSNGNHGQPPCPCKTQNIVLVQAVYDAVRHPTQFDTDAGPGKLPPHNADDPIPGCASPGNLTIIDAPHFPTNPDLSGTWRFEDCAVCRTTARDGSISDQVLGCIKFLVHRNNRNEVQLSVQVGGTMKKGKSVYIELAEALGKMWKETLADWRKRGN